MFHGDSVDARRPQTASQPCTLRDQPAAHKAAHDPTRLLRARDSKKCIGWPIMPLVEKPVDAQADRGKKRDGKGASGNRMCVRQYRVAKGNPDPRVGSPLFGTKKVTPHTTGPRPTHTESNHDLILVRADFLFPSHIVDQDRYGRRNRVTTVLQSYG